MGIGAGLMPDNFDAERQRMSTVWGFVPLAGLFGGVFVVSLIFDLAGLPVAIGAILGGCGGFFVSRGILRSVFKRHDQR